MRLRGLVFDLDGTLGDTIPVCMQAFQRTLHHYRGRHFTEREIFAMFGPSEEGMFQRQLPGTWPQALETYLAEYERAHVACREPFPGMIPFLRAMQQRGVRLGVVTGKGPRSARISASVMGLDSFFDGIEAGSPEGSIKPVGIRAFLSRWAVEPAAVAYVGDAPYDIDAAKHANVVAVAAAWAPGTDVEALAARHPDVLFRQVAQFATWADSATQ